MSKSTNLQDYFPLIRERNEVLAEIKNSTKLSAIFDSWLKEHQEEFLDICTGAKGIKITYNSFFKEIFNSEYNPQALNSLLSSILRQKVKILNILPNDGTRIADEDSLIITDMVVELEDGSIANVEIQKIGYMFPGERAACYSADLLLRQYKRLRDRHKKNFRYSHMKPVYTIVIFESSPKEFLKFQNNYIHYFEAQSDTGIKINLLQKFVFVSLDIFKKLGNNNHNNELDAWLSFLTAETPEEIIDLIHVYPEFKSLYNCIYEMCRNMEDVMGLFSKELQMMDKNTVKFMIDEMQEELGEIKTELDEKKAELNAKKAELDEKKAELDDLSKVIAQKDNSLAEKDKIIAQLQAQLKEKS